MAWKKLGLIIEPKKELFWMRKYAMLPTAEWVEGDIWRVYFSGRDDHNRSYIGSAIFDIKSPKETVVISNVPVLCPGDLGCFDDNGVTPSSIVSCNGKKYLYYVGWKPRSTTRFGLITGLAISSDGKAFQRYSKAPILQCTNEEPITILTAPFVLYERQKWRMWYVSGVRWISPDLPQYNIKYAESNDGISWNQNLSVCIDAISKSETALGRPCVLKEKDFYAMWYSYKRGGKTYRIGYAESRDGIAWNRLDKKAEIDVSDSGWDSEMIEYGFVFRHKGKRYMLYNGNGYGIGGAGLAVEG